ncbi:MAG: DUF2306 domain-containing protein [Vulcanimicrobiota bacterium]
MSWYLLVYIAGLYGWRAASHILGDPDHFSPYFHDKYLAHLWLVRCHGVSGALNLMLGPWLLSTRVRRSWPRLHRSLGRLYFAALIPAAGSGLILSSMAYGGRASQVALGLLCTGWIYTGWRAVLAIRQGRVTEHRHWMVRHYALTLAAVSLRVQTAWLAEAPFPAIYARCAWLSWLPNLLLAELWIRRMLSSKGAAAPPARPGAGLAGGYPKPGGWLK